MPAVKHNRRGKLPASETRGAVASVPSSAPTGNPILKTHPQAHNQAGDWARGGLRKWREKTFNFLWEQCFDPAGGKVLLAVSGGRDSMALLHFWRIQALPVFGGSMGVATVNHGLRGEASLGDARLVEDTCKKYRIPFHLHRCQPREKPNRLSPEMWGRRERYAFFQKLMDEHGYQWVMTAHHQLDQLETLLLRLERGTQLQGLQGIHFKRDRVVRPFLNRSPEELREYALAEKLPWREDASNADVTIPRNWLRHLYIPRFTESARQLLGPTRDLKGSRRKLLNSVSRLCLATQELWPQVSRWVEAKIQWSEERQGWVISREALDFFFHWHPWVGEAALSALARKGGIPLGGKSRKKILEVLNKRQNIQLSLTQGCFFYIEDGAVGITQELPREDRPAPVFLHWTKKPELQTLPFTWDRDRYLCRLRWRELRSPVQPPKNKRSKRVLLDAGGLSGTLTLRTRKAGDRFSPLGMHSCRRKLKDYFNGIKLPAKKRDKQILVCNGNKIAWIAGLEISEYYKIRPETRELLELEIECLS